MKISVFKYLGIFPIRVYQVFVSPFLFSCCRFEPSCSSFAITALNKYGLLRGVFLAFSRIISCHPWSKKSGYDPVR